MVMSSGLSTDAFKPETLLETKATPLVRTQIEIQFEIHLFQSLSTSQGFHISDSQSGFIVILQNNSQQR